MTLKEWFTQKNYVNVNENVKAISSINERQFLEKVVEN